MKSQTVGTKDEKTKDEKTKDEKAKDEKTKTEKKQKGMETTRTTKEEGTRKKQKLQGCG